jgi:hypothetical protein
MPSPSERDLAERVRLGLVEPIPAEVPVGSDISFKVRASCAAGSDLGGGCINLAASEEILATQPLVYFGDGVSETAAFALRAPETVGAFTWIAHFPGQEIGGVRYEGAALPIEVRARPLQTILAVWDIPTLVVVGERFTIKVGAKSSGASELKAACVEIRDEAGQKIGESEFGEAPLPQTDALYWTEVGLTTPAEEGSYTWRVAFAASELKLPHDAASTTFGFTAVRRPDCRLTVSVIEGEGAAPIADVQLGVCPYRAATDAAGRAHVDVPSGSYRLDVWHTEFEFVSRDVDVRSDTAMRVELTRLPKERTVWD